MHEFSIVAHLLEAVETQAQKLEASQVLAINLVVGERSGLVDESVTFYFDMLAEGTVAEGAKLNIRRTPMRFACQACETDYTPPPGDFHCPECGTVGQIVDDASHMMIESIEINRG
jgi:hydrogenase nickel incorporation protein HypA/HybF